MREIYQPAPVPYDTQELPRYLQDELRRIADMKADRIDEAVVGFSFFDTILIEDGLTPTWQRLIQPGDTPDYLAPDVFYDQTTGLVTAIDDGGYLVSVVLNTQGPGGNGNRDYFLAAAVELNWDGASAPSEFVRDQNTNDRDILIAADGLIPVQKGDTIDVLGAAWADQFTIVSPAYLTVTISRQY